MNETAIRSFYSDVLDQYPEQCRQVGACGMVAKRAIELAGYVAAGLEEPETALELARQDAAKYRHCEGQNISEDETYQKPKCGSIS